MHKPELELSQEYHHSGKLLDDTGLADVTFAADGRRFPAHRCVLAARSAYLSGLIKSPTRKTTASARWCAGSSEHRWRRPNASRMIEG